MQANHHPQTEPMQSMIYEIRVQGHLGHERAAGFEGMALTLEDDGSTLLIGPVADQAALHGLLRKVRDAGMVLLAVTTSQPGQTDASHTNQTTEVQGD